MGGELAVFDPNDYRKRVLAVVERRGGPDTSDPFELYDLPLQQAAAGLLADEPVAARVAEVWGFWQRQRDHPKYRVLVGLLVDGHAARSAELLEAGARRLAAIRVRTQREQRESVRYELLDAAVSRLVERHRGLPRDKVEGLYEVGALAGLSRDEVATRLRRHRMVDPAAAQAPVPPPVPAVSQQRRRQVRALLDELARLTDSRPAPTLLALLGLGPEATGRQIAQRAAAWRARARELPPERPRAVLDELLVHVAELLEPGRAAVDAYLDAVAADVADHLRPRVRAAVLVEDRLVAEDHAHLLEEAVERGLDREMAARVLAALAAELGTTIQAARGEGTTPRPPAGRPEAPEPTPPAAGRPEAPEPIPPAARPWEQPLKAARAALRAGRPAQARQLVAQAEQLAGTDGRTPVRAVADEVAAVLTEARLRVRAAESAAAARRWSEAGEHLAHLARTASDAAGPDLRQRLEQARQQVEQADRALAAVPAGPVAARMSALQALLDRCTDHPGALAALAAIPLSPPTAVRAVRAAGGVVVVSWVASDTPGVTYRVGRQRADGSWQVLGRVGGCSLEDGGAPPDGELPIYTVVALQAGRGSDEARSDGQGPGAGVPTPAATTADPAGAARPAPGVVAAPTGVHVARQADGAVLVRWAAGGESGAVEYRVRCRVGEGSWRVVGRTTATSLEDGGAPPGELPVYAVSAAAGGVRSAEASSHG